MREAASVARILAAVGKAQLRCRTAVKQIMKRLKTQDTYTEWGLRCSCPCLRGYVVAWSRGRVVALFVVPWSRVVVL